MDTLPGKCTVTRPDAALTPYGGLAAGSGFLKRRGLIERLADHCPGGRTSPNAPPGREVLHSFLRGALVEGKRFCQVRWGRADPAVATLRGRDRGRGEEALPRLGKGRDRERLRQWLNRPQTELYAARPERFIADWDSTVNPRYGHQAAAAVGYNPHQRGRKSQPPPICVAAPTRLCLPLEWRPGDTVSATDWQPAMEKRWSQPTIRERRWRNRGDGGLGAGGDRGLARGRKPKAPAIPVQTQAHEQRAAGDCPGGPGRCGKGRRRWAAGRSPEPGCGCKAGAGNGGSSPCARSSPSPRPRRI